MRWQPLPEFGLIQDRTFCRLQMPLKKRKGDPDSCTCWNDDPVKAKVDELPAQRPDSPPMPEGTGELFNMYPGEPAELQN